ncbi:hypothetical protein [Rhizobium leguminosarum]
MRQKHLDPDQIISDLALDGKFDEKTRRRACRQLKHWCQDQVRESEDESLRLRDALEEAEQGLKHAWTRIMMGQIDGNAACVELDRVIKHIHSALEQSKTHITAAGS